MPVISVTTEIIVMSLTLLLTLVGIGGAYLTYICGNAYWVSLVPNVLYNLSFKKVYVDEFYNVFIVSSIRNLAWGLWRIVDTGVINGGLTLIALTVRSLGSIVRYTQTGIIQNYALIMVIGILLVVAYMTGYLRL